MAKDALHYPREALALSVLQMFTSGLSSALTLFAPRRMGKTEFLLKDVQPLAQSHGWRVCYFSFMEGDSGEAARAFPAALSRFADEERWLGKAVGRLAERVKLKGSLGPASFETNPPAAPVATSPTVSACIADIARQNRPVLLLLDEIQELARKPGAAALVASLRTGLDQHRDRIKVIFTGSSQAGLRAMFGDAKAPFFHFATMLDFPPLDQGFTRHLAAAFHDISGRRLDEQALWAAFEQLGRVPLHLRALVEELALNPGRTLEEALPGRLALLADTSGFEQQWQALSMLEQGLLGAIAGGETSPYGKACRDTLAARLGLAGLSASTVQSALRKLERHEQATRDARGWRVADPVFAEWIKERA